MSQQHMWYMKIIMVNELTEHVDTRCQRVVGGQWHRRLTVQNMLKLNRFNEICAIKNATPGRDQLLQRTEDNKQPNLHIQAELLQIKWCVGVANHIEVGGEGAFLQRPRQLPILGL